MYTHTKEKGDQEQMGWGGCLVPDSLRGGHRAENPVVCLGSQERLYQKETYELGLEGEVHLQMPGTQQFQVQLVFFRRSIALDCENRA